MPRPLLLAILLILTLIGCRGAYYSAWEKIGYEKRDILTSRVKSARAEQEAAKEQFKTTLEQFQAVTGFTGGNLEAQYRKLNSAYERSVSRAQAVSSRIASIEQVAGDLFREWKKELSEYENPELRRSSQKQLNETQERYRQFIDSMKRAEKRMQPVLAAFKDQVLFLKHNLNAAAIASLQTTAVGIEQDVAQLIAEMEASIREADAFIKAMK